MVISRPGREHSLGKGLACCRAGWCSRSGRGRGWAEGMGPCGHLESGPEGVGPELGIFFQALMSQSWRNVPSPLPSASDTTGTGSSPEQSAHHWSVSGVTGQSGGSRSQSTPGQSLHKEAWAPECSTARAGAPRWSWDKLVDSGDGPRVAPGTALRSSLRRRSLGDPPAEGGSQEWAREPPARSRRGAKARSPGTVTWADL